MPTVMEQKEQPATSPDPESSPPVLNGTTAGKRSGSGQAVTGSCPFHSAAVASAAIYSPTEGQNESQSVLQEDVPLWAESNPSHVKNGLSSPISEISDDCLLNETESSGNESLKNENDQSTSVKSDSNSKRSASKSPDGKNKNEFSTISFKLLLPTHTEPLDVIHTAKDTVNDLMQYAFEKPDTCYRTCLSVRMNGKKLDNFAELGSVTGLKDGSIVELVEEPYTLRDVLAHVQRVYELIGSNLLQSSLTYTNGLSLSFLLSITSNSLETKGGTQADESVTTPPEHISPVGDVPLPLSQFFPENYICSHQTIECLKQLSFSNWNPPVANRRFKGDILYIDIKTLEGEEFCVTACPSGFYLNRSVPDVTFDPAPRKVAHHCQHLVTLLQQISGLFKKNFTTLQKEGAKKNAFEVLPVPYPIYPWVVPKLETKPSVFRIDDTAGLKAQTDELLVGQLRDWNEEIQATRELPATTVQQRMYRDRALFKVHSEFVQAAVRGARAAVDGHLQPLNPADPQQHHMYLWNNIFFSTGFDGRGHFKDLGGEEASHTASNYDLRGVSILDGFNIKGLYTLGAVLIDYRGNRVFAQSIVPGLLQREHDSSIIYGSMDNGKTFEMDNEFHELLKQCSDKLHLRQHKVLTEADKEVELPVSLEVKGINGTDGRRYVLDLFRILPPDFNYVDESSAAAESTKRRHKLYTLRPELVDNFIRTSKRIALELQMYEEMQKQSSATESDSKGESELSNDGEKKEEIKQENTTLSTTDSKPDQDAPTRPMGATPGSSYYSLSTQSDSAPTIIVLADDDEAKDSSEFSNLLLIKNLDIEKECEPELVGEKDVPLVSTNSPAAQEKSGQSATKAVPISLKDFNIKFNPDIFAPGVRHADPPEELERDRKLATDLAGFLTHTVIPKFVKDCVYLNTSPIDSASLQTQLHSRGISLRYLGKIAMLAKTRDDLSHLHRLCVSDMILRTARRKFRKTMLSVPYHCTVATVAQFLNCLLTDVEEALNEEGAATKKKAKRKRNVKETAIKSSTAGKDLSQGKLWKSLLEDMANHYHFILEYSSLTRTCNELNISKLTFLREFCLKTGVQIMLKEYKFSSLNPFHEDDIINLVPVVKVTEFKPLDAAGLYELAQMQLQAGHIKVAHEYFLESVQLLCQVYGPMHVNIANCYRFIARIYHSLGENTSAITYQQKTVFMFERLLGVDHSNTVSAYFHLAQYCCAAGSNDVALKLLYRVRYLMILVHGEDHPEMANVDFYIGLILSNCSYYEESQVFLENTLKLQNKFHGDLSIAVATTHHLLANSLTHLGSFAEAKQHEKKAYTIYRTKLGPEHARTVQSYKDARYITEKQVSYGQTLELAQGINRSKSGTAATAPSKSSKTN